MTSFHFWTQMSIDCTLTKINKQLIWSANIKEKIVLHKTGSLHYPPPGSIKFHLTTLDKRSNINPVLKYNFPYTKVKRFCSDENILVKAPTKMDFYCKNVMCLTLTITMMILEQWHIFANFMSILNQENMLMR